MLPSETMIWQPEFTDKTLSRKPGAVHWCFNSCWSSSGENETP
ncbi:PapI protein [Escherichia coli O145]|uniref:PapI protein n=2 Tax=Escherichia coli TaxID=562 RepID=A0A9Q6V366_ECOLX|nr:PapI protein [Escherichia coli O145 str. RM9872]EGE6924486.1 PapI protein [Escherichia coli]QCH96544.1 PapI protein [Escherichia coli O145:NM]QNS52248.1 PapI protein [Escherichia coli O145]NYW53346.1 PapI protein [Escherichia coli]